MTTNEQRIAASKVRVMCGDICDMTLYRWLNDAQMDFPKPIVINRRRYWRASDINTWLEGREGEAAA